MSFDIFFQESGHYKQINKDKIEGRKSFRKFRILEKEEESPDSRAGAQIYSSFVGQHFFFYLIKLYSIIVLHFINLIDC